MAVLRSIPTTYQGTRFASALEADWAKTLDRLGIVWQYEPDGVYLPSGVGYRCDFYLPRIETWFEVKGPHNQRIGKPGKLADALVHAPGCGAGRPESVLSRPEGVAVARCQCGCGADYPFRLVVVGRASTRGKAIFEAAEERVERRIVVISCPVCQQRSFADADGATICRRCRGNAAGATAWSSGRIVFSRVAVPVGGRRRAS
jgi:hypothetical protein